MERAPIPVIASSVNEFKYHFILLCCLLLSKILASFCLFFFVMSRVSGNVFWYQAPYKHWTGQIATALGTWICVQTEWKVVEPINSMILFKCAELEEERSKWLNTKLSVVLYTYPQFPPTPVF